MNELRLAPDDNEYSGVFEDTRASTTATREETTKREEDVCSLCLSYDRNETDSESHIDKSLETVLLRYCDQCKCVLHPACMQNVIKNSKTGWIMFPTLSTLQRNDDDTTERQKTIDSRFVFVPQPIEQILQIAIHHRLLDLRAFLVDLVKRYVSVSAVCWLSSRQLLVENRFVLAHRFSVQRDKPVILEYVIGSGSSVPPLPKERRLDTSILYADNTACSLSIETLPDTRCISCRKPTRICRRENSDALETNKPNSVVFLWAVFVLHAVLVTTLSLWSMRSIQHVTRVPDFVIFALPFASFLHVVWWSILAGPMWYFYPTLWCTLTEIIVKQRHSGTWNAAQIVSLGNQLEQFGKHADTQSRHALLHSVRMLASPTETFLITSLIPGTYRAPALFLQGIFCSRALWQARLWGAASKDDIWETKLSTAVDKDTGRISVNTTLNMDEKFQHASTFQSRFMFYVSGIVVGSNYAGLFGGMSWRAVFVVTALSGGIYCGDAMTWAIHVGLTVFEMLRLCFFAYMAWIWIPCRMPNLTTDVNCAESQNRFIEPVAKNY